MFIQGNISLRVRKPFKTVVATSDEDPGLILKKCDSEVAFSEAPGFGFPPAGRKDRIQERKTCRFQTGAPPTQGRAGAKSQADPAAMISCDDITIVAFGLKTSSMDTTRLWITRGMTRRTFLNCSAVSVTNRNPRLHPGSRAIPRRLAA